MEMLYTVGRVVSEGSHFENQWGSSKHWKWIIHIILLYYSGIWQHTLYLYTHIYCSTIHKSQVLYREYLPINRSTNIETLAYIHMEWFLALKKNKIISLAGK
jgi:hypothetical protein